MWGMGLTEWVEKNAPLVEEKKARAACNGSFEGITLKPFTIKYKHQGGDIAGATARVELASDIRRRVTATRLVTIGVFAFAAKKNSGHVYLTVEHPDYEFVVEISAKKESDARKFAAKINNAARHTA